MSHVDLVQAVIDGVLVRVPTDFFRLSLRGVRACLVRRSNLFRRHRVNLDLTY